MKKLTILAVALTLTLGVRAQNAYDAELAIGNELNGTARFVGMGGAMGALGADMSSVSTNPAALGLYRSSDFAATMGFNSTSADAKNAGNDSRTRASFDQVGFVYATKLGNYSSTRYLNWSVNYHKARNFNRLSSMENKLNGLSQTWQLAQEMHNAGMDGNDFQNILDANNPYSKYWDEFPILGVMGVTTGLIDYPFSTNPVMGWDGYKGVFFSDERGGINQYDFSVGINLEDRFYIGATLGLHDLKYNRFSSYTEYLNDDDGHDNGDYTLTNYYMLRGTGVHFALGAIIRPIEDSPFRFGLAIHTPTFYDMTEENDATIDSDVYYFDDSYSQTLSDYLGTDYLIYDYRTRTPWKFNINAGTTIGRNFAVGAEYELEDYSAIGLNDVDGYELGDQQSVRDYLKCVSTLRLGAEARVDMFSFRCGYNFSSAAFADDAYNALSYYGTRTDFNNKYARNTLTLGLGFNTGNFYADAAYKFDTYKSDFYAFDDAELPTTEVTNNRSQVLFTLGFKF